MTLTADGEFFKCDMCGTYFHMNIFCSHRRQCKGLDSKEMKKELIAEVQDELDRACREKLLEMQKLNPDFKGDVPVEGLTQAASAKDIERMRAPLEVQQKLLTSKRNAEWQRKMDEEEDAALEAKLANTDDLLAMFDD
eukprot:TRINITY_DN44243_c0_g1_i1.p2 TRINITY_DN44243_c0_g1~~TRINITY_DN44243_c0_g1_i1.p2  ORF type:complete len:138 (+),score=61.16 TRINITY_DN44243_c0_g1_i1:123-536(+)